MRTIIGASIAIATALPLLATGGLARAGVLAPRSQGGESADPHAAASPALVSVPDPYAPTDCGSYPADLAFRPRNEPHEPVVATNPVDPDNIVVAYTVDGYVSNLVRTSFDGGRTWKTVQVAPCGTPLNGTSDPSLAFSADGKALYLSSLAGTDSFVTNVVVINRSTDGGLTWSDSSPISATDGLRAEMDFLTTDPRDPATAYITFEKHDVPEGKVSHLYFSRTDNSGTTWTPPSLVYQPESGLTSFAARILPLPDGGLVDVFQRVVQVDAPYE
ncbi:MAG: sialidase family protein, partial [Actinomycetota bacterium]